MAFSPEGSSMIKYLYEEDDNLDNHPFKQSPIDMEDFVNVVNHPGNLPFETSSFENALPDFDMPDTVERPDILIEDLYYPPERPTSFCNEDYAGPCNFEVDVHPSGNKTPWEYSAKLNKIYIDQHKQFPISFTVSNRPDMVLFIRATPVFVDSQYSQDLVHRCISHEHAKDPSNKGILPHVAQHVLRCSNGEAHYFGNKNSGERLNVVIPFSNPEVGTDHVREYFEFVCKTSCPAGMNRRPIQVIFTLENHAGDVKGRRVLYVKICSCPKRDREKDELNFEKSNNPSLGKKRRVDKKLQSVADTANSAVITINMQIVGEENKRKVLDFCRSQMAQELIARAGSDSADLLPYRQCYEQFDDMLNSPSD